MAPAATRSDAMIGSRCVWTVIPVVQEVADLAAGAWEGATGVSEAAAGVLRPMLITETKYAQACLRP